MDLTRQFALPQGLGGRVIGALMAVMNAAQVKETVRAVAPKADEHVLEIGFGPGIGLVALATSAPGLQVAGVDPSATMVAAAGRRTRRFADRVQLHEGTAAALPFPDATFDAVCATNSVQLWRPRAESLAEVLRVLKPGGRLVLSILERAVLPDGGSAGPHFDEDLRPDLEAAGYADLQLHWRPSKLGRALSVTATRPL
ncbi:class I SAM-dependent methyltransferase [Streptacidiphilus sp. MAP12-20]|uniref:class I SAM-dependent methyltransferase n=1 Tax=Streptacidiphilus sp. MAP12-20 TaxID=3156299 RepID=UPI0035117920